MPPEQCPSCGRFLRDALVETLDERGARPCPHCGEPLTAAAVLTDEDGSVRPPDLPPDEVRAAPDDVLVGWDLGVSAAEIESWRADRRPVPVDTIVVAAGALVGGGVGAAVDKRRVRGGALGLLVGTVLAAGVRRIWRLPR